MVKVAKFTSPLSGDSRRNSFRFFLSSNPAIDYLRNSPQCFSTLRHIGPKHLEDMIHVLPGLQNGVDSLTSGMGGEGLNAVVENLAASGLNVDRRKTAQVGPKRRYQRLSELGRVADQSAHCSSIRLSIQS